MNIHETVYQLTISSGGAIRIEREGFGQNIDSATLFRHGWNSIADTARLIERQILEKGKKP